jgi:hypothetical protein
MEYAQKVFVSPVEPTRAAPNLETDLQRARQIAMLLDAQFNVAGIKFGMDAIVGLVPGIGDAVTTLIGLYPLYVARRHGLGRWVTTRMAGNLLLDFALGAVPVLGDIFDVAYKANLKNLDLLEKAVEKHRQRA